MGIANTRIRFQMAPSVIRTALEDDDIVPSFIACDFHGIIKVIAVCRTIVNRLHLRYMREIYRHLVSIERKMYKINMK